ncbi:MAG: DUF4398 domain-containing protein [Planctomycetaceae bacterium]
MLVLRSVIFSAAALIPVMLVIELSPAAAFGDEVKEDPSWRVAGDLPNDVELVAASEFQGDGDERGLRIQFRGQRDFRQIALVSRHPPALPLDEFQATLRFSSSVAGVRLALKLILPNQIDPRTGTPLSTFIPGDRYSRTGEWQTLAVSTSAAALEAQLRRVRAELHRSEIDASGAYVHGCVLLVELNSGDVYLDLGSSTYGPVVAPTNIVAEFAAPDSPGNNPSTTDASAGSGNRATVRIARSQVFVDEKPVFPRLTPDHGESPQLLRSLGMNAIWVSDYRNSERQQELLRNGLVVVATPPRLQFDPANYDTPLHGLLPLEQSCPLVSAFYLGTRVDVSQSAQLMTWTREVRSADRILQRPLMVDMTAGEGIASREVDMVGIGEHVIGRNRSFGESRNLTYQRQRAASQLTLPWTWLQTEPSSDLAAWRTAAGFEPMVIESEQFMMQLVAALSGGCRGIGYWKTRSLQQESGENPAAIRTAESDAIRESALSIELNGLYLHILEPFLVEGRIEGHIAVQMDDGSPSPSKPLTSSRSALWDSAMNGSAMLAAANLEGVPESPDAAVITSGINSVVLAGFWDNASQFVPQPMYSRQAQMTVAASETASAWRVTATGISSLRRNMTAGGLQLAIPDFDQFAVFLVSSDPEQARELDRRIRAVADRAAHIQVELARLKYERVLRTSAAIDELGRAEPNAASLLRQAAGRLDQADQALAQNDARTAERFAQEAARQLRFVQQQYWRSAVKDLPSPTASPHTVAFSSLPDHWRMLDQISAANHEADELLPSGSFDNLRMIEDAGWKRPALPDPTDYRSAADVVNDAGGSQPFLRMLAWKPSNEPGNSQPKPSLLVMPPAVDVTAGDVLEIRGRIRTGRRLRPETPQPLMIFDNELGPEFAVRPKPGPSWQTFRMFRQASQDGQLQISFVLYGSGEVHLDDVSISRVSGPMRNLQPAAFLRHGHVPIVPERR